MSKSAWAQLCVCVCVCVGVCKCFVLLEEVQTCFSLSYDFAIRWWSKFSLMDHYWFTISCNINLFYLQDTKQWLRGSVSIQLLYALPQRDIFLWVGYLLHHSACLWDDWCFELEKMRPKISTVMGYCLFRVTRNNLKKINDSKYDLFVYLPLFTQTLMRPDHTDH